MKLGNVFAAKESFVRLAGLSLPSKVAYKVLKFSRKFDAEYGIIEQQRTKIIRDITGAKESESASIEAGTPSMKEYLEKLASILNTDCDLARCPLTFAELLDAVDSGKGNALSVQDLALLEPFFEDAQ